VQYRRDAVTLLWDLRRGPQVQGVRAVDTGETRYPKRRANRGKCTAKSSGSSLSWVPSGSPSGNEIGVRSGYASSR